MLQHVAKCDCDRYSKAQNDGQSLGAARDQPTANMHKNRRCHWPCELIVHESHDGGGRRVAVVFGMEKHMLSFIANSSHTAALTSWATSKPQAIDDPPKIRL